MNVGDASVQKSNEKEQVEFDNRTSSIELSQQVTSRFANQTSGYRSRRVGYVGN